MPRQSRHELLDVLHHRDALCHAAAVYAAVRAHGDGRGFGQYRQNGARVIAVWSLRGSFGRGLPNFSSSPVTPLDRCSMIAATLFPSVLGAQFAALDPCLRWVHSGESRRLRGSVTVERGSGVVARMLGV